MRESFSNVENSLSEINQNNKKITSDIEEMKNQIIKNLVEQNKDLQNKVKSLEHELENQKNNIEANNQYHRRNNMEIAGIPNDVDDEVLEEKVIQVLQEIEVNVEKTDIEACHRLPASRNNPIKRTIIRFTNRKNVEKSMKNKKKLNNINMELLNFPAESKLFISEKLNRHYQKLGWHCRQLFRNKNLTSYKYQNEAYMIKFKKNNNEKQKKITHENELFDLFPEFFYGGEV